MIANQRLIFAPRKSNLNQIDHQRSSHQPVKIVVPAWVEDFIVQVTRIAIIAIQNCFEVFFHAAKMKFY